MIRKPTRKLAALAALGLLAVAVATPSVGSALPPPHTNSIDPFGCPICGGGWDDFLGLLKIQIDLFASILTGLRIG